MSVLRAYEECDGLMVTETEALRELRRHGIDTEWSAGVKYFYLECWNLYVTGDDTIDAKRVLDWLGY